MKVRISFDDSTCALCPLLVVQTRKHGVPGLKPELLAQSLLKTQGESDPANLHSVKHADLKTDDRGVDKISESIWKTMKVKRRSGAIWYSLT